MKRLVFSTCALLVIAGCAKRADAIAPVEIPIAAYSNQYCVALSNELVVEREKLAAQAKKQNQAATGDAVGVFLVGVPTASLTGHDQEGELAVTKGKVLSIENAMRSKNCDATLEEAPADSAENTTPATAS